MFIRVPHIRTNYFQGNRKLELNQYREVWRMCDYEIVCIKIANLLWLLESKIDQTRELLRCNHRKQKILEKKTRCIPDVEPEK